MRLPQCVACLVCICMMCIAFAPLWCAAAPLVYDDVAALMRAGKYPEAKAALERRISAQPRDVVALSMLGDWYQHHGDRRKAVALLERSRAVDPSYPMTYYYLCKAQFMQQDVSAAVQAAQLFRTTILQRLAADPLIKPQAIVFLHDIGEICFSLKEYEEFRATVDAILALEPRDQSALYNRGIYSYVCEHNRSRAYQYFVRSAEINTDPELTKKARYAIEFMRTNPDARVVADFSFLDRD